MWNFFISENIKFALDAFVALVLLCVAWLYFDAWSVSKKVKEIVRFFGFLLLSASFVFASLNFETGISFSFPVFIKDLIQYGYLLSRTSGYLLTIISLLIDPLQPKPKLNAFFLGGALITSQFLFPPLSALVALLYLRRGTVGLEDHVKPVGLAFFMLSVYEILSLGTFFAASENVIIIKTIAPYGPVWFAKYILLFLFAYLMGKWIFGYLLKRFDTQFFIILTTSILSIFLVTTVSFTFLLLKNIYDQNISRLATDVKVLNYAVESKKSQSLSDSQVVAESIEVKNAIKDGDRLKLFSYLENYVLSKKGSKLIVTDASGVVLARGEDRDKYGDSLVTDPLVERAVTGHADSSITAIDGPIVKILYVEGVSPIKDGEEIIGSVISASILDNSFIDGVKNATGLEASLYVDGKLSATSIQDIKSRRPIGAISKEVSKSGSYSGLISVLNKSYLATFAPIKDVDNEIVGSISIAKPEIDLINDIAYSIQLTFIGSIILLVISIVPSYLISKYISDQIK